jgi:hypothetical protein
VERRTFLTSVLGSSMLAAVAPSNGEAGQTQAGQPSPEFYVWRQYVLRNGTQPRALAEFLRTAAIPALNRLGHKPIGAFEVVAGVPSPTVFLLTPCSSLDSLAALDAGLEGDAEYARAGAAYIDAPATEAPYVRQEVSLLAAFPKMPRIAIPAATAAKGPRLFELRTYENPSEKAQRAKIRMFSEMGEIEIFRRCGLTPVFFSRMIVGPHMPNITYMLVHENTAGREKSWDNFRNDPEWKKVAATPGYSDAEIVSNITTVLLRPAAYSQI